MVRPASLASNAFLHTTNADLPTSPEVFRSIQNKILRILIFQKSWKCSTRRRKFISPSQQKLGEDKKRNHSIQILALCCSSKHVEMSFKNTHFCIIIYIVLTVLRVCPSHSRMPVFLEIFNRFILELFLPTVQGKYRSAAGILGLICVVLVWSSESFNRLISNKSAIMKVFTASSSSVSYWTCTPHQGTFPPWARTTRLQKFDQCCLNIVFLWKNSNCDTKMTILELLGRFFEYQISNGILSVDFHLRKSRMKIFLSGGACSPMSVLNYYKNFAFLRMTDVSLYGRLWTE